MTSRGIVAENNMVCLSTSRLLGRSSIMSSISLEKPSSKSRSASSRTNVVRPGASTLLYGSVKRSFNRPGVATRIWHPSRCVFRNISRLLFPPTATCTIKSVALQSFEASTAICSANSRVGEMMIARMSEGRALEYRCLSASSGLFLRMFWIVGRRNPIVFPVPVFACAILYR